MAMTGRFADLASGDQFAYRDTQVCVLQDAVTFEDRFGRTMFRLWAQRADTGDQGWVEFGPDGRYAPLSAEDTDEAAAPGE